MTTLKLGALTRVPVREVWQNEAGHFTPWLALPENIVLLGQTIGLDLQLDATEKFVGPFRADILCRETVQGRWVLVENQLERTDHTHLGQLLTYSAGLNAVTVVWIAPTFTDEHRAAIEWLNNATRDGFDFFGLEIELWRIGDSAPAPKFNIVAQPNNWTGAVADAAQEIRDGVLTEAQQLQRRYWAKLCEILSATTIRVPSPPAASWMNMPLGRSNVALTAVINSLEKWISARVICYGDHGRHYFRQLLEQRPAIEAELGEVPNWNEKEGRKEARVQFDLPNADWTDETDWARQHQWFKDRLLRLQAVFANRVRALTPPTDPELDAPSSNGPITSQNPAPVARRIGKPAR